VDVEVDAQQDEPPQEDGEQDAGERLQPDEEDVAVIPRDDDADDHVNEHANTSEPDGHFPLGSSP
jgi:hypothetical protein